MRLLGFKDLFLVGFFLNIGINGTPSLAAVGMALVLTIVMPVKAMLFFGILTRFRDAGAHRLFSILEPGQLQ